MYNYITAVHGNELSPVVALSQIRKSFVIANKMAVIHRKRYINVDMNSIFGLDGDSYEYDVAKNILNNIDGDVIDFHTFSCHSHPFAIITDEKMVDLAMKTGVNYIIHMKHNIKGGHSLIDLTDGVSVEVGSHTDFKSIDNTISVIKNLEEGFSKRKQEVYEVYDIIDRPGVYVNFSEHSDGFIPVLAGEKSYDFYGLKARKIS